MKNGKYIRTEETRKKMRIAMKGNKNGTFLKGHIRTPENILKIKEARKRQIMPKGEEAFNWKGGKPKCVDCGTNNKSYATRCYSCYLKNNIGRNHNSWKGGTEYGENWTDSLRESIRIRDNYICQECGIHQDELLEGWYKKLDIHHIDYNKLNHNPENLISLCRPCHTKTNFNKEHWINYFNNKIS